VANNNAIIYRGDRPLKYILLEECISVLHEIATLDRGTSPKMITG